jgi:putative SOS response-associated peptidase YedK
MARADWLTALALRTLEDALAQSEYGAVDRTWGQRLALSHLLRSGIATEWQVRRFWQFLGEVGVSLHRSDKTDYIRSTSLHGTLDNWHYEAGMEPPDSMQRSAWAEAIAHRVDSTVFDDIPIVMCNRSERGDTQKVLNIFRAKQARPFNDGPKVLHPKDPGPVIRLDGDGLVLDQMTWGFPVELTGKRGQKLKPKAVNNARFDKLGKFWKRWAESTYQRCLIPTARYAEAVGEERHMTETWLSVTEQPIFAWAGLWAETDWGLTYTGVMTGHAEEFLHIHDRSPVIIDPKDWMTWLTAPLPDLYQFDRPYPAAKMTVEETKTPWYQRTPPEPGPLL